MDSRYCPTMVVEPFSLLEHKNDDLAEISKQFQSNVKISDAYPCTPLQEGLVALSMKEEGWFTPQIICRLPSEIDILRFKAAWQNCVDKNDTLRTVFVQISSGLVQVVLEPEAIEWVDSSNLETYLQRDRAIVAELGSNLLRYGIVYDEETKERHFVWTYYHAVMDGWAVKLLMDQVDQHYRDGTCITLNPFNSFIEYFSRNKEVAQRQSAKFWAEHLSNNTSLPFPAITEGNSVDIACADSAASMEIGITEELKAVATPSTIIQAAWSLLVARNTRSSEATFGMVLAGRNYALKGVSKIAGPTITTIPVRVMLASDATPRSLFQKVHELRTAMKPHQHLGLQNIRRLSAAAARSCKFENLLVIQPQQSYKEGSLFSDQVTTSDHWAKMNAYAMMMQCDLTAEGFCANASFDSRRIPREAVLLLLQQLKDIVWNFSADLDFPLQITNPPQIETKEQRISSVFETEAEQIVSCVHRTISQVAKNVPSNPALVSWDGEMSYWELECATNRLAHRLRQSNVGLETMVPLLFDKSMWTVVAMLAVMKAGGVFVPLDPAHPEQRLLDLIAQTGASLLLCSENLHTRATALGLETIPICASQLNKLPDSGSLLDETKPSNACYVLFTSGTTSQPKGCVIEHLACCTMSRHLSNALGMTSSSRMLQLSAYTFDGSILEIFVTLSLGGCVCVPSDDEKMNNVAIAISRMNVNAAFMTPSFSKLVDPDSVPTLKTLVLGGEKLTRDASDRWMGKVRLMQIYGPTETCVACITSEVQGLEANPSNIGPPIIGSVVLLNDKMHPVHEGEPGELYLGGPHLARGYLNDPVKTAAAFVTLPGIIDQQQISAKRWYKTGDLVKWAGDASSIIYLGRKDTQVKVNGQRIEVGEVEANVRKMVPNIVDVTVVVASPPGRKSFLAAFILQGNGSEEPSSGACMPKLVCQNFLSHHFVSAILDGLHKVLPDYMIPKAFVPMNYMPLTSAGKTDRKLLEVVAADLSPADLKKYSGQQIRHEKPESKEEISVQRLWAKVLNVEPSTIGRNDNFIRLGGDSILAMKLVAVARGEHIGLSVRSVFMTRDLAELANTLEDLSTTNDQQRTASIPRFSLLGSQQKVSSILKDLSGCCSVDEVDDIYPCTPFQEGIMALSMMNPGTYVAQHVFQLSDEIVDNLDMFKRAWATIVEMNPILRTKLVQTRESKLLQVVCKTGITWQTHDDLAEYIEVDKSRPISIGQILNRHAIVRHIVDDNVRMNFVWTTHHACYDGWSMRMILKSLEDVYRSRNFKVQESTRCTPFNLFVRTTRNLDDSKASQFWHQELGGAETVSFPAVEANYVPRPTDILTTSYKLKPSKDSGFRTTSLIKAAWAITASTYSNAEDICFGLTLTGRTSLLEDFSSVAGPTITTIPVRARVNQSTSVLDFIQSIEASEINAMPYEQFGLAKIRQIDEQVKAACNFQTLLVMQPKVEGNIDESFLGASLKQFIDADVFDTYALTMECHLEKNAISVNAIFDPNILPTVQMNRILRHFEHVLHQLCQGVNGSIKDINTISASDAAEIQKWNSIIPAPSEACVHHLIEKKMLQNPEAPAICSWDGDWTRGQLDRIVSRVAHELSIRGIGPESKVPVLFNKSKWAIVATLAVIKAGGCFVPLDPRNPVPRLVSIVDQINAKLMLCSPELGSLSASSFPRLDIMVIDEETVACIPDDSIPSFEEFDGCNDLYIIFTSGSTGAPKGTIVQHGAYCAGARDHAKALHFKETSRFLQFASYSFDTSVEDILTTLITGGCLCIPSEEERASNIVGAISRMAVNAADLTPSFITSMTPDDVPTLRQLTLGGEPLTSKAISTWANRLRLINAYGVSEACVTSLVNANVSAKTSPSNIGFPAGALCWIVDASDSSRILPIGAVGELVIEGPALARGYLNDPERTKKSFVDSLSSHNSGIRDLGRHYKTGDLAEYNPDGSINYISRKDTQIKLRGQRVELGDIESHLLSNSEVRSVAVILPTSGPYQKAITALVELKCLSYAGKKQDVNVVSNEELKAMAFSWEKLSGNLRERLPPYMVPSYWIAIEKLPLHTSGKLDRPRLSAWVQGLSAKHQMLTEDGSSSEQLIPNHDKIAMEISRMLAEILAVDSFMLDKSIVGRDMQLVDMGIDSIKFMSVATNIKRVYNISVPMSILVSHKTKVSDVARHIRNMQENRAIDQPDVLDLVREFRELDAQIEAIQCPLGNVFLTGATGYLGTQILRQLLVHPGVDRVFTLVRTRNAEEAVQKLQQNARHAKWSITPYLSKLEIWTGDLTKPMLGLTSTQWSRLEKLDAVIHNGASVNWNGDYHGLKAANVHSTLEILKKVHASSSQMKLVYVTGGRSFDDRERLESTLSKLSKLDGYSQTKFVSESLVRVFAAREAKLGHQPHISIVEPGLIMGTAGEGIANVGDFVWRYVAAALSVGTYPKPDIQDWLEISSSDRVARATIDSLLKTPLEPSSKTKMTDGISMVQFWKAVITHTGQQLHPVSSQEWKKQMEVDMERRTESHPLWPVAHLISDEGNLGKGRRARDREFDVDEELMVTMGKNIASLIEQGFLNSSEVL